MRGQRGTAIVLALLTVSFAAMVSAALLADFGHSLERVSGRRDQAQSRLLARAAVDWARNILAQDARESATDHPGENWTVKIPPMPLGSDPADGTIAGEITDLSGRFNLNDLAPKGKPDAAARLRLQRLLELIGEPPERASAAGNAITRGIASRSGDTTDNAPHSALLTVDELSAIADLDPDLGARLAPYVTAVPPSVPINVNVASAEVLAALIPGLGLDAARAIVAAREHAWFRNLGDLALHLPKNVSAPSARLADVRSRHFLVTIHAAYGVAVTRLEALLERERRWPDLLWYRLP